MPFGLGCRQEGYGGDDATDFALGIENRGRLARQGRKQMLVEFRTTCLADGVENLRLGA